MICFGVDLLVCVGCSSIGCFVWCLFGDCALFWFVSDFRLVFLIMYFDCVCYWLFAGGYYLVDL